MINEFLIFYAPFLLVIVSIMVAFWIAYEDSAIKD